jgi:DNA-binding FadR family transcriptional regulator
MSVIEPIQLPRAREAVTQQIETLILTGKFTPGDKLPSEQELANSLQVGRRAVREALQALQAKGLVEVRMGSGAFVVRNDLDSFLNSLSANVRAYLSTKRAELAHCSQFREIIEGAAIDELARSHAPARLERLEEALARQEAAADAELYNRSHLDFHRAIVDALDNPIISMLFEQVLSLVQEAMEASGANPTVKKEAVTEHRGILEAVRRSDRASAHKALTLHLEHFQRNLGDIYTLQTKQEKHNNG